MKLEDLFPPKRSIQARLTFEPDTEERHVINIKEYQYTIARFHENIGRHEAEYLINLAYQHGYGSGKMDAILEIMATFDAFLPTQLRRELQQYLKHI